MTHHFTYPRVTQIAPRAHVVRPAAQPAARPVHRRAQQPLRPLRVPVSL
jgi:hypothetical protein